MALWAFHNNPGIGGFGESNPVLFDGTNKRRERKKQNKERSYSPNYESRVRNEIVSYCDGDSSDGGTVCTAINGCSIGEGDLVCQIVKELVDNAVDACRSQISEHENLQNENWGGDEKTRIRVDIRPFTVSEGCFVDISTAVYPSKEHRDDVLQVTVTDTGCGMENIQKCVNAFQSSKDRGRIARNCNNINAVNNHSSGRYGIGLTLCLLHAQRCVPNSRACISSATPRSKFRTRAFFEVDKREDSIKCVQEEVINVSTSDQESGTCVSLLVPGGTPAKLAWPRLHDYFTRFRLCTKLHFELDVFAPTLSKLPIYIRSRKLDKDGPGGVSAFKKRECAVKSARDYLSSDEWEDLLDGNDGEEENDYNSTEVLVVKKRKWNDYSDRGSTIKLDQHRYEFLNAAQTFWPNRNIVYDNVACSVRNIQNRKHQKAPNRRETGGNSKARLEVKMAVCPHLDHDEKCTPSADSATTTSNDTLSGDENAGTLQVVRIVNGVPIMESAEAHSCGLIHGVANKATWGSFGLDIDRSTSIASETSSLTPFLLRDSSLIAQFINKNPNHKQLKVDDCETIHNHKNEAEKKKRKRERFPQKDLLPANVRIGSILIVVQICAAPSSLPLPSLSKGRLPLKHQPIDSALQLALRDCLVSLQSTNPTLFLTTSKLRTVERDVHYIPRIASAVSRIICRSTNQSLRCKSLELFPKTSTSNDKIHQESISEIHQARFGSSTAEEQVHERKVSKIRMTLLANTFESRLRVAIKAGSNRYPKKSFAARRSASCFNEEKEQKEKYKTYCQWRSIFPR